MASHTIRGNIYYSRGDLYANIAHPELTAMQHKYEIFAKAVNGTLSKCVAILECEATPRQIISLLYKYSCVENKHCHPSFVYFDVYSRDGRPTLGPLEPLLFNLWIIHPLWELE